ncbi:MAG: MnhB domain-containing protein [Bacteroidales bacterium]
MKGMSIIVKKVTQLISGIIFMYGIYIITHGHLTPGGGFAGGAIIAGAYILLILAFGSDAVNLRSKEKGSSLIESLAILIVLLLAVFALFMGTKIFFANYLPKGQLGEIISAGAIPLYNIFIGIEVAAAIITIFLALIIFKEEAKK